MGSIEIPDLDTLVQPLLGTPYQPRYCFDLARDLIFQGFGLRLDESPNQVHEHFMEIWYREDSVDPLRLIRPWDALVMFDRATLPVSTHVGLALDAERFVHARDTSTGVAIEKTQRYRSKLLQIARLRRLL